jgi:hypothetical protein
VKERGRKRNAVLSFWQVGSRFFHIGDKTIWCFGLKNVQDRPTHLTQEKLFSG